MEEHLSYLEQIFQQLQEGGTVINLNKFKSAKDKLDFLGFIIKYTLWTHIDKDYRRQVFEFGIV